MNIHINELTEHEEQLLYKDQECPKRIHINNRRIWWVQKNQYDKKNNTSFTYSICPKCYREKKGKVNKIMKDNNIKFIPIIVNNQIAFNCDASEIDDTYNILLNDDWKMGIYQKKDDTLILLDGYCNNNNININVKQYPINIVIGLYKKEQDNNKDKDNEINTTIYQLIISNTSGLINKHYIFLDNNEYIFTLYEFSKLMPYSNLKNDSENDSQYESDNESLNELNFMNSVDEDILLINNSSFNIMLTNQIINHTYKLNFNNNINDNNISDNIFNDINYENFIIEL